MPIRTNTRVAATLICLGALSACGPAAAPPPPPTTSMASATLVPVSPAPSATLPTLTPVSSVSAAPSPARSGEWRPAARMIRGRHGFDAVVLGDDGVLAVGDDYACVPGGAMQGSESAERYDSIADVWAEAPSLNKARKTPATVDRPDGSALVIGGINPDGQPFSSTKRFASDSDVWSDGPLMELGRSAPLGVTLANGAVLVVSETTSGFTSERLDPATNEWMTAARLPPGTRIDAMVSLRDGSVLGVGTDSNDSDPAPVAYRYDPAHDRWTSVEPLSQLDYELVALPDGGALAVGGNDGGQLWGGTGALTRRVHRFDPGTGSWTELASITTPRREPQVIALDDGRVIVAGGATGNAVDGTALKSTEIYDPTAKQWVPGADLLEPRYGGHALALADGSVLVLGGANDFNTEGDTPWCPTPLVTTERLDARS